LIKNFLSKIMKQKLHFIDLVQLLSC
jgi:hypothetical protein